MRVGALGPVTASVAGRDVGLGGPKQRLVLALLIHQRGRTVSSEALADGLWGDDQPENARKTLQVYISNLRKALGDGAEHLTSGAGGYRLESIDSDVDDFERMVTEADEISATAPAEAAHLLDEALRLWRGTPYADCDSISLRSEITRLDEMRLAAVERRLDLDLDLGRHVSALAELGTLAIDYPFRERIHGLLMLALYRSGRQAEALRAFAKLRTRLVDELGIEPSPELQRLEQQILDQDPGIDLADDSAIEMHRTVLLFTDLVASTALWDVDQKAMAMALDTHDRILDKAVSVAGGRVWKHTGDGVLAVMPDVDAAVTAASRAQSELSKNERLKVRMAIHVGDAHRRGDDYFGPALNVCARLLAAAHGGQTLLSEAAVIDSAAGVEAVDLGEHRFKGAGAPVRVHQLGVAGSMPSFPGLAVESPALAIERIGFGRSIRGFELRERIGAGPMGEVYRAFQSSMSREVALKVVDAAVATEPEFVRRFEADARVVTQLEHPHIVPIHDSWRDPEGAYLVMRFMRGGSLAKALRAGTWKPAPALRLLEQVGAALSYAHRRGVLHLDVHAGNVLVDEDGNAYLTDFVIAGGRAATGPREHMDHIAPEVLRGQLPTVASDLYSLGVLAAGVLGIASLTAATPVADVLDRATAEQPERRFERVDDLLRALRQALGADVVVSEPALAQHPGDVRNPYKGLRAFQERDADDFFGRDELTERLLDAVGEGRLVAIVGPSGCGKSSAVKAGLIPRIRAGAIPGSENWHITEMFPGSYPFEELEEALLRVAINRPPALLDDLRGDDRGLLRVAKEILPDGDAELLLIVDQFEELFSLTAAEDTRRSFMEMLATAVTEPDSRVRVVLTMRADFLDRPLAYTGFGELLERAVIPVAVPSEDGLTLAIVRPARQVGLDIEPGLVGQIVRDVADQPGALPLMQHALTELFVRSDRRLTIGAYEESGGVLGALGARAEELYLGLTPAARPVARQLLLRLVNVEDDTADIRRRAKRTELRQLGVDPKALDEVLQAFGSFRLLTFDQDPSSRTPTVEVAHEALLREWPRLRAWIEEESDGLRQRRRLIAAVQEWHTADRDPAYLLAGGRLEHFEEWALATDLSLTIPEAEYLHASRSDEDRRRNRRNRARTLVGAVLAAAAAVAIVFAVIAQGNQELAQARELAASAIAVLDEDPELSVLLALEAASAAEPPLEAVRALHEAVQNLRLTDAVALVLPSAETMIGTEGYATFAAGQDRLISSADGSTIVEWRISDDGGLVQVDEWTVDGAPLRDLQLASSANRAVVAAVGADGRVVFRGPEGGAEFGIRGGTPRPLGLSADGAVALVGTASGTARSAMVQVVRPFGDHAGVIGEIEIPPPVPVDLDVSADGSRLLVTTFNPGAIYHLEITENGLAPGEPIPLGTQVVQSDIHPNGTQVASAGFGGWLVVTDLESGSVTRFHAHDSNVRAVRYNRDGSLVAAAGDDGTVRVFDPASGREVMGLFGHASPPRYMAFSSDGETLVTAGQDHVLRVWDLTVGPSAELGFVDLGGFAGHSLTRMDDLAVVITRAGSNPGPGYLVDLSDMSLDRTLADQWGKTAAISNDGTRIAMQVPDDVNPGAFATGSVVIRNGAGDELFELEGICQAIASGTDAIIHDAERFDKECEAGGRGHGRSTNGMVFSPSGALVAVSGASISVSDVETGRLVAAATGFATESIEARKDHMAIGFTPDEARLVVAVQTGQLNEILVLDARTLDVLDRHEVDGNWGGLGRLHHDGDLVVVPNAPGTLDIVDLSTGEHGVFDAHESAVSAIEFSEDRSQLITAGAGDEIKIWDIGTWNGETMDLLLNVPYIHGSIEGITVVGDQIVVVDSAGHMARLTTDTDELIAIARERVTRTLTDEECSLYLHTDGCET